MAETVFATFGEYGMQVSSITGAKGSLGNLLIRASQYGDSLTDRVVQYNYESKIVYSGTNHARRRGINLAIFDLNMNVVFMATYDTYTDENASNNLADKMKSLTSSQIATLTSWDAIKSNAKLDEAFSYYRSNAWPKAEYFNKGADYCRTSYASVICGKKKNIVAEKFVGHGVTNSDAEIEMAFGDPTSIGYSGFGRPIISDDALHENTGTSNIVKQWANKAPLSQFNIKVGDSYYFESLGETDAIAAAASSYLDYEIIHWNSAGASINSLSRRVSSVEGWQEIEIRDKIPSGCTHITVQAIRKTTREAPRSPNGTVYVKNTVMQLSDNDMTLSNDVSIGLYGTSVKGYADSLGSFDHYDPEGYYQSAISESNIIRNTPITQNTNEPVRWMDRVLDSEMERTVVKTTGDLQVETVQFTVDPKKFYYVCVWVNKHAKSSGQYMLGYRALSASGAQLETTATDGSSTTKWMYSQHPTFDMLETRQWYLLQGFILPHNVDRTKALEFIEANKEFYGWDDLYGNGIGVSDEGNGYYGWINNKDAVSGKLAFLDYYNKTEAKSLWALPIVKELSIGSIDIDDGILTSINLSG